MNKTIPPETRPLYGISYIFCTLKLTLKDQTNWRAIWAYKIINLIYVVVVLICYFFYHIVLFTTELENGLFSLYGIIFSGLLVTFALISNLFANLVQRGGTSKDRSERYKRFLSFMMFVIVFTFMLELPLLLIKFVNGSLFSYYIGLFEILILLPFILLLISLLIGTLTFAVSIPYKEEEDHKD